MARRQITYLNGTITRLGISTAFGRLRVYRRKWAQGRVRVLSEPFRETLEESAKSSRSVPNRSTVKVGKFAVNDKFSSPRKALEIGSCQSSLRGL